MKISKIIKDKYKLRIPPIIYYDLLADVVEAEEEQEPKIDVLNKIRAELMLIEGMEDAIEIIDKYRERSE